MYRKMAVLLHPDKTEVNFLDPIVDGAHEAVKQLGSVRFLHFQFSYGFHMMQSRLMLFYSFLIVFMQRLTEHKKPSNSLARLGATFLKLSENRKHLKTIGCCEENACGNK